MSKWSEFDKNVNCDEINKDLNDIKKNSTDNTPVPYDTYEVKIERMELKESKNGYPMLSVMFRIVKGEQDNRCIFMNQVAYMGDMNDKYRIKAVFDFLKSLDTDVEIGTFKGIQDLDDLINKVFNSLDELGLEYLLKYYQNDKGYDQFKIKEVFESD